MGVSSRGLRASPIDMTSSSPRKGVALTFDEDARVAQLAEHLLCKQGVAGSIPVAGSRHELAR
jgi:hypothetical protein